MHPDWVRDLRDQVRAACVAFFLKQAGSNRALWPAARLRHARLRQQASIEDVDYRAPRAIHSPLVSL
jgi:hypothetical protein